MLSFRSPQCVECFSPITVMRNTGTIDLLLASIGPSLAFTDSAPIEELGNTMDWFCNLPDEILTHILSFLSTKEAVQTCILSKKWRHAWAFLPVLKFSIDDWVDTRFLDVETMIEGENKFENFLYGVLENRRPTQLDVFVYNNCVDDYSSEISLDFLDHVALLKPRMVYMNICRINQLDLPDLIFSCASLELLELRIYTGEKTIIRPEAVHLPALKVLYLMGIALSDDDRFMQKLCLGCPVLAALLLKHCHMNITEISSEVLKGLAIFDCYQSRKTRISCPCLEVLIIDCDNAVAGIELKNTALLQYANLSIELNENHGVLNLLNSLSYVSYLRLGLWGPQFKVKLEKDMSECRIFSNLQVMEIAYWGLSYDIDFVIRLLKHSPSLEELVLHPCEVLDIDPKEEPSQEELRKERNVLFQREYLKTVTIVKPKWRDMAVDRLIKKLHAHIKTIEKIIIS